MANHHPAALCFPVNEKNGFSLARRVEGERRSGQADKVPALLVRRAASKRKRTHGECVLPVLTANFRLHQRPASLSRCALVASNAGNKIVPGTRAEATGCPRGDVGEVAGIGVVAVNGG